MSYEQAISTMPAHEGVEESTMMKTPCLRYKGAFLTMMFDKEAALITNLAGIARIRNEVHF